MSAPLRVGTRLGTYEIIAPLGQGGMGAVYRARDTRLGREVALKVLLPELAHDTERLARFEREARTLAALNHQHIAHLYGLEVPGESTGATGHAGDPGPFLVMELVEGRTLQELIEQASSGLPVDEALAIARQIAEALEAAHDQGIIHRDLKPANIKVRPDGTVKVLDFGLAKALEGAGEVGRPGGAGRAGGAGRPGEAGGGYRPDPPNLTSPTITSPALMTGAGVILGTAAYMAPEQARGKRVDRRADIWAFGCVLYEMLTGRRAFGPADTSGPPGTSSQEDGRSIIDTLAAIVRAEPDWTALPGDVPRTIRQLLRRCLAKDPKQRLDSATAVRLELLDAGATGSIDQPSTPPVVSTQVPRRRWLAVMALTAAAALVMGAAIDRALSRRPSDTQRAPVTRFIATGTDGSLVYASNRRTLAVSPDGSRLAYFTQAPDGVGRTLMLRLMDSTLPRPLAQSRPPSQSAPNSGGGPDGDIEFSPDGKSVVYFSGRDRAIFRVSADGGMPTPVCQAVLTRGISWAGDELVFADAGKGIMRVPAAGGEPRVLLAADRGAEIQSPQFLDGGRRLLYAVTTATGEDRWDHGRIMLHDINSGSSTVLLEDANNPAFTSTGHLLFVRKGVLFAVALDLSTARMIGTPVAMINGVSTGFVATPVAAQFAVSASGTLAYLPSTGTGGQRSLARLEQGGRWAALPFPSAGFDTLRVSPDGQRLAVGIVDNVGAAVWIYELGGSSSSAPRRLTTGTEATAPIWTPDGHSIVYRVEGAGGRGIARQPADGSSPPELLTTAGDGFTQVPETISPDGATLVYGEEDQRTASLWTVELRGPRTPKLLVRTDGRRFVSPALSPNGRWLAYSLREELGSAYFAFVEPFPSTGARYQLTTPGPASTPVWSRDGSRLLVAYQEVVYGASVETIGRFSFSPFVPLPTVGMMPNLPRLRRFDLLPDGTIIAITPELTPQGRDTLNADQQINVVVNWTEELKARVPRQ